MSDYFEATGALRSGARMKRAGGTCAVSSGGALNAAFSWNIQRARHVLQCVVLEMCDSNIDGSRSRLHKYMIRNIIILILQYSLFLGS